MILPEASPPPEVTLSFLGGQLSSGDFVMVSGPGRPLLSPHGERSPWSPALCARFWDLACCLGRGRCSPCLLSARQAHRTGTLASGASIRLEALAGRGARRSVWLQSHKAATEGALAMGPRQSPGCLSHRRGLDSTWR